MADLAITNSFSAGTAIVASQMNTNFTDVTTWANNAPNIGASGQTTTMDGALTVTEALIASSTSQFNGTVTVGVDDTGHDVKFFGATATNGYMLWDESEDDLVFGSAVKVGIGTAPERILHIKQGDSGATPAASHHIFGESDGDMGMALCGGTGNNVYIRMGDSDDAAEGGFNYDNADDSLMILTNNKDYIKIKSTGNVAFNGNGTTFTSDHGLVEINQPANNDESGLAVRAYQNGRTVRLWASDAGVGYLSCGDGGGNILNLNQGGGNVGVGTDSPASTFTVAGNIRTNGALIVEGTNATAIRLTQTDTDGAYISFTETDGSTRMGYIGYPSNDDLHLKNETAGGYIYLSTGGTSRVMVDTNGFVYIGDNITSHPGTDGYLNVESPGTTPGVSIFNNTASATAGSLICRSDVGGAETLIALIETNGDFQSATNSYGSTSDERLKTTEPCRDYLDDLLALDVVNFRLTKRFVPTQVPVLDGDGNPTFEQVPVLDDDGNPVLDEEGNPTYSHGDPILTDGAALMEAHPTEGEFVDRDPADYSPKHLGLVAQQVEEHIPGLVKDDDYGVKSLRYSVLVPMLLQAVQTLTARIAALEAAA